MPLASGRRWTPGSFSSTKAVSGARGLNSSIIREAPPSRIPHAPVENPLEDGAAAGAHPDIGHVYPPMPLFVVPPYIVDQQGRRLSFRPLIIVDPASALAARFRWSAGARMYGLAASWRS